MSTLYVSVTTMSQGMSTLVIYYTQVCKITYTLPGSIEGWLNFDIGPSDTLYDALFIVTRWNIV